MTLRKNLFWSRVLFWVGIFLIGSYYFLSDKHILQIPPRYTIFLLAILLNLPTISMALDYLGGQQFPEKKFLRGFRIGFKAAAWVGILLFIIYSPTSLELTDFGFNERSKFALGAISFSLASIGLIGAAFLEYVEFKSPIFLPDSFVRKSARASLIVSVSFLFLFPVNYLGNRYNQSGNVSFFKTASPGETTVKLVKNATSPLVIRVFRGPSSEVGLELERYFEELKNMTGVRIDYFDQPSVAALSEKLNIRENGYISISNEAIQSKRKIADSNAASRPQTIRIGSNIESIHVKGKLRDLDTYIRRAVIALEEGRQHIFVTEGHGELDWDANGNPIENTKILKDGLESYNYLLRSISRNDGLSTNVPEKADLLLMIGPDYGISKLEYEAIVAYLKRGHSALFAIEAPVFRRKKPMGMGEDFTHKLLEFLGLVFEKGMLLSKKGVQPITHSKQDRMHFLTTKFYSHPSIATIQRDHTKKYSYFLSTSGALRELDNREELTIDVVVKSPAGSWLDTNGNLEMDRSEKQSLFPVAVAIEGKNWRAFVVSDATAFSDFAMMNVGNQQFSLDVINWLNRREAWSGELSTEKDLPFTPTKSGQALWFYLSVVLVPLSLLIAGWIRVRWRRVKSDTIVR